MPHLAPNLLRRTLSRRRRKSCLVAARACRSIGPRPRDSGIPAISRLRVYSWYPEGAEMPRRSTFYPSEWRSPEHSRSITNSSVTRSARRVDSEADRTTTAGGAIDEEEREVGAKFRSGLHNPTLMFTALLESWPDAAACLATNSPLR